MDFFFSIFLGGLTTSMHGIRRTDFAYVLRHGLSFWDFLLISIIHGYKFSA